MLAALDYPGAIEKCHVDTALQDNAFSWHIRNSSFPDNNNYKEHEMEIGFPTDVKHVAHIGWDGPSVNAPSWMNEFKSVPDLASAPLSPIGGGEANDLAVKLASQDLGRNSGIQDSPSRDKPDMPKPSRRHQSSESTPTGSPCREAADVPKQSRRQQSAGMSINIPAKEISDMPRQSRRSGLNTDLPSPDIPGVPKHSRRKKSKGSSGGSTRGKTRASLSEQDPKTSEPLGGSVRSSKSKASSSSEQDLNTSEPKPALDQD